MIGNSIGEKNKENILNYFTHHLFSVYGISVVITLIGLNFSDKIFSLIYTTKEVTELGLQYTDIIFSGSILFILVVALNSLLHAEGDTKTYRNVLILSFFNKFNIEPNFNIWSFVLSSFRCKRNCDIYYIFSVSSFFYNFI